jgi:winged helix DNA-binding protein
VIWWTGVSGARIDGALEAIDTLELEAGLLLRAEDEPGFLKASAPPRGRVDLLPKWDSYTMGYPAGARGRFADPGVAGRLYDFRGDGLPAVLVNGAAAGTWSLTGKQAAVEVTWFDKPTASVTRAFERRAAAVRELLA